MSNLISTILFSFSLSLYSQFKLTLPSCTTNHFEYCSLNVCPKWIAWAQIELTCRSLSSLFDCDRCSQAVTLNNFFFFKSNNNSNDSKGARDCDDTSKAKPLKNGDASLNKVHLSQASYLNRGQLDNQLLYHLQLTSVQDWIDLKVKVVKRIEHELIAPIYLKSFCFLVRLVVLIITYIFVVVVVVVQNWWISPLSQCRLAINEGRACGSERAREIFTVYNWPQIWNGQFLQYL